MRGETGFAGRAANDIFRKSLLVQVLDALAKDILRKIADGDDAIFLGGNNLTGSATMLLDQQGEVPGSDPTPSEGERAAAVELALEGLYLARKIGKDTDGFETVYG